jgi:hypothetical protein
MFRRSSVCWAIRLAVGTALSSACSTAQTQKVIDEYLRALGGAKVLSQIRSETLAGSLTEESTGRTGSWALIVKAPNRFYSEVIVGQDRVVAAYNGMGAWGESSSGVPETLTGEAAKDAEADGRYWNNRLTDLKKGRLSVQPLGIEKVRGQDAYHVRVIAGPGTVREVFFDVETHLIARETSPSGQFDYEGYRLVSGVQTPSRIGLAVGEHEYKIAITRAEFNTPVEDSVFDFPVARGTTLPDIKTLILEVTKNQQTIEAMQKQYTCHLTTEEEEVGSKGATSRKTSEFEVFHIAGDEVRRLLARDGKPLTGDAKKKEDDRFSKEFEKRTKEEARLANDPKKQAKRQADDEAQISDFLRAESFRNARRERFRGQDVIAVDFGPNPDFKPKNMAEGMMQKLAGVMWIDEKARDVARLEAHVDNSLKIGGGALATIEKGTSFVFEQARINDEVWLPSYMEVHVSGRALLLVKLKANEVARYTDYKKFHSESKIVAIEQ